MSQCIVLGLFLARIRWFSERNLDAITTEAIRVRTAAVDYARSIFSIEMAALKATCSDSEGLKSGRVVRFHVIIRKICLPPIVIQVS